ncbi:flagellar biosynthetic protein FliR [Aestuariibacter sp. A3R04]|uniref:flagellar biosynthetic protein FliR n=1 Tax=Aestuariibacter sp. A3R04 TaxID=2841571 RepID=UPI001C0A0069|nr:flagellar biosynthetic protein FliR [Aestuariibacter sp. A3R04]MBU3023120.1 flagellar biosynthetic protein FliR [Aestuariibacter sp. A3R04]
MNGLISVTNNEIMQLLGSVWWPFVRFSAFFWAMPVFDNPAMLPRARILLSFFLAFLVAPQVPPFPDIDVFSLDAAVVTVEQILFGVVMGLALRMLFEVMAQVGLILSMQMGLSMALVVDPGSGNQMSLLGNLFWLMTALLFFAINGHLISLQVIVDSFYSWPIGASFYQLNLTNLLLLFGWIFSSALLVALPSVIAMLLVNMTFGIASRAAPSLNIFVLGFPMSLLLGFLCVFLTLSQMGTIFSEMCFTVLDSMRGMME